MVEAPVHTSYAYVVVGANFRAQPCHSAKALRDLVQTRKALSIVLCVGAGSPLTNEVCMMINHATVAAKIEVKRTNHLWWLMSAKVSILPFLEWSIIAT